MEITEIFYAPSRAAWREWLFKFGQSKTEIWLQTPKKITGLSRVPYEEAVEEALCFGWIDGIAKSLDEHGSVQRYTPRRKRSFLSELNRQRIWKLQELGLMTPEGIAPIADQLGSPDDPWQIPTFVEVAMRAVPEAWENFLAFPLMYQRLRVGYVLECIRQKPDEAQKRLRNLVYKTSLNRRFGTEVW